jgi:alpha-mannosidase
VAAGPQVATPEGQCLGRHVLEYALRFDADRLDDVALLRESQDYRSDFLIMAPGVEFEPPLGLEGEVVFSCLKGAENGDGLVMRIFNPRREATVARALGPVLLKASRLDESPRSPLPDAEVEVGSGEIATCGCGTSGEAPRRKGSARLVGCILPMSLRVSYIKMPGEVRSRAAMEPGE